jgi:predicted phage tail protein
LINNKYLSVFNIILGIVVVILAVGGLTGIFNSKVVFPYMFTCLGLSQLIGGISSYLQGKKVLACFSIAVGVFIFIVTIIDIMNY